MKIFKVSFLMTLLTSSYVCQAMNMSEIEKSHTRSVLTITAKDSETSIQNFIKENFIWDSKTNKPVCLTEPSDFSTVHAKFEEFLTIYPHHKDLKLSFARFLLKEKQRVKGLITFSQVVLTDLTVTGDEAAEFMNSFKLIKIDDVNPKIYIDSIHDALTNPNKFAKDNKCAAGINNIKKLNERITEKTIETATLLLALVKKLKENYCYDAILQTIISSLDVYEKQPTASKLVSTLYNQELDKASPLVKRYYVHRCLMKEKQYERAVPLYESILGNKLEENNYIQTSVNYNALAVLYIVTTKPVQETKLNGFVEFEYSSEGVEKLQKAVTLLETAQKLNDSPFPKLLMNLAGAHLRLQQYKKALEIYRPLMKMTDDELKQHKYSLSHLKRDYLVILHAAGETEELHQIHRQQIEERFTKDHKIAELIKAAQIQAKEEKLKREAEAKLQAEKREQEWAKRQADLLKKENQIISETIISESEKEIPQLPRKEKVDEIVTLKQPKKKTKGITTKQNSDLLPIEPIRQQRPVIYIQQLGLNKTSQKTFYELFAKYTEGRPPRVSLREINSFCADLDGNKIISTNNNKQPKKTLDTHRATSHHKLTFSPQDFGIEGEEQMAIITNLIEEKPYQVQHLLDIFLSARIVPDDPILIKKLEEEGLL